MRPLGEPSVKREIAVHRREEERTPATAQRLIDRTFSEAGEAGIDSSKA
jgi:hypothetical protein